MTEPAEFHASVSDVTDEEHQYMAGLLQNDDFNAAVIVRFLQENGIEARSDEHGDGSYYKVRDPARESDARFACVCLRASISYAIEAVYWCLKAKK